MAEQKFTNTLYTNDNLFILNGMNSNSVDLIYLDPPFNSKRIYSAPIGSKAAGVSFKDMWTWQDVNEAYLETLACSYPALTRFIASTGGIHSKAMMAYLTYMAQRIIEMCRVLKDTGSIYLHCDPTASHYLKILLDEIFGKNNFRNEISWRRNTSHSDAVGYGRVRDVIFFYSKTQNVVWNDLYQKYEDEYTEQYYKYKDADGRRWMSDNLSAYGLAGGGYTYEWHGHTKLWRCPIETMRKLEEEGKIFYTKNGIARRKRYLDEAKGIPVQDDWYDVQALRSWHKERIGYPTQKPLALLHRIIKASSNEGDIVFDPFCGCATTCVAAQQLGRKWIGIDIEKQAVGILVERLSNDAGLFKDFVNTTIIPQRTDITIEPPSASVKERLYNEQKGLCNACGTKFDIWNLEIDHIVPKAKGGCDFYENYQLLCGACNKIKGARPMEYLRLKIKTREETMENKIVFGE
jgi:site-specific DNA-methyltransferase (adenine-specific)